MALLTFEKLHGLGNDFVFFDGMSGDIALTDFQVASLCDRHFGIGADGVIVVKPSPRPECAGYMHYINSDGTLAQMCGNGVRCFAKFLVDHGYVAKGDGAFVADTLSGPKPITFTIGDSGLMEQATVNMGQPILQPDLVPVALPANATAPNGQEYARDCELESPWGTFCFTCVSMGNPHAVCFLENMDAMPAECFSHPVNRSLSTFRVDAVGAYFEKHPAFPEKANIEFAVVEDETHLSMRVFERGCGETFACGTGTCATVVAASLTGRAAAQADMRLLGGTLHIDFSGENVMMTGPAELSFQGTVEV